MPNNYMYEFEVEDRGGGGGRLFEELEFSPALWRRKNCASSLFRVLDFYECIESNIELMELP